MRLDAMRRSGRRYSESLPVHLETNSTQESVHTLPTQWPARVEHERRWMSGNRIQWGLGLRISLGQLLLKCGLLPS